jgi:hypothetical protein
VNGNGYESAITPSAGFFTKEQRQRLEAITVARKLYKDEEVHTQLNVARWIIGEVS